MKKTLLYFLTLLFWSFFANSQVSFFPEKPKAGETVNFVFNPSDGLLASASSIKADAYYFDLKPSFGASTPIVLQKDGKNWKGSFGVKSSDMVGIIIAFRDSTGKNLDNNKDKGYTILVHDTDQKLVKGANLGLALIRSAASTNPSFRLKRDAEYQLSLFEKEFTQNPELKSGIAVLSPYLLALAETKKEGYKEIIEKEFDAQFEKKEPAIYELSMAANIYKLIGLKEKAEKYAKIVREKEPVGMFVQTESMKNIMEEGDADKKIAMFEAFEKEMPNSMMLPIVAQTIINTYIEKNDVAKLKDLMVRYENKMRGSKASFYNSIAWKMAEKDLDLPTAETFSRKSMELVIAENEKSKSKDSDGGLKSFKDTYGYILEKLGRIDEAYQSYKEALGSPAEKSSAESNERYILAAIKTGHLEEAKTTGELYTRAGKSTEKMKEALKDLYVKTNGIKGADEYVVELEKESKAKNKEETLKKIISETAPTFTLKDLDGKTVSLADLRGKVVIIDFWATWCGPCIQSFPGMQKAQLKYKDNPNVKFLFINTWERTEDFLPKVKDFVTKKKYVDFTVPVDVDNKVVVSYKVEGIPTKFIIDGQGNIRFKSVGFSGSTEGVVEEVSTMIDALIAAK